MTRRTVDFVNHLAGLNSISAPSNAHFLVIDEDKRTALVRKNLLARGMIEIDKSELYFGERRNYRDSYVDFIGALNINNASFKWWAFNFTSKNYFVNELCRQLFYASLIARLARQYYALVIVINDRDLAEYLKHVLLQEGVSVQNKVRSLDGITGVLRRRTPAGILYCVLLKLRTTFAARRRVPAGPPRRKVECLLITLFNHQSFDSSGAYRDTYLGPLREYLESEGLISTTVGAAFYHDLKTIRLLPFLPDGSLLPLDAFTPVGKFLFWAVQCVLMYFSAPKVKGDTTFNGLDVAPLILKCIKREIGAGNFLLNVWYYLTIRSIPAQLHASVVVYPFENRSWEKMLVLALRAHGGDAPRLVGYQHAAITPRHSSLFFAKGEWDATPVPDSVVTTGDIPRDILVRIGQYPENRTFAGIGLRHPAQRRDLREGKIDVRRILIILSSSVEEYVKSLLLLNKAFEGATSFDVVIRPHPTIPLSRALELIPPLTFRYRQASRPSAAEDLWDADVACYTSSTAAIEAIALGVPLVYMDLGDFMDPDPLFDFSDLKWTVRRPADLLPVLEEINSISPSDLEKRRLEARAYALSYIRPADATGMKEFIETVLARKPIGDELNPRVYS